MIRVLLKNPVSIIIDDWNRSIHRIIYRYGENYGFASDEHLTPNIITQAGELFLLSSPIMFYQMFAILENATDKEGLIESLHNIYLKYKEFYNASIKGTLEYQECRWPYSITVPDFCTSDTSLYKMSYDFILDDECKLQSIVSQFRCLDYKSMPHEYKRGVKQIHSDNPFYPSGDYDILTHDVVEKLAESLCQSDIEEYKKLLGAMNHKDQYYEAVINGGAKYADNIERLLRKAQR